MKKFKIYIGADHAGFESKEKIISFLEKSKMEYEDFTPKLIEGDDYPDYAFRVGEKVSKNVNSRGILVCGTGTGMVIAANKVKGIRAVEAYDKGTAKLSREHNDTNVIALSGWNNTNEKNIEILKSWLNSDFSNSSRHRRRINKIISYERKR